MMVTAEENTKNFLAELEAIMHRYQAYFEINDATGKSDRPKIEVTLSPRRDSITDTFVQGSIVNLGELIEPNNIKAVSPLVI